MNIKTIMDRFKEYSKALERIRDEQAENFVKWLKDNKDWDMYIANDLAYKWQKHCLLEKAKREGIYLV